MLCFLCSHIQNVNTRVSTGAFSSLLPETLRGGNLVATVCEGRLVAVTTLLRATACPPQHLVSVMWRAMLGHDSRLLIGQPHLASPAGQVCYKRRGANGGGNSPLPSTPLALARRYVINCLHFLYQHPFLFSVQYLLPFLFRCVTTVIYPHTLFNHTLFWVMSCHTLWRAILSHAF